jgi:hypothetical protein
LYSSVILVPGRAELTAHGSRYIVAERTTTYRKHMSRDHHPPLRDVIADTENIASSIVACWAVFTELFPGYALITSVTIFLFFK